MTPDPIDDPAGQSWTPVGEHAAGPSGVADGHGAELRPSGRPSPLGGDAPVDEAVDDPLVVARIALDDVDGLPLEQRAAVFERVHATVVEELRQLELG